ncbi:MAG: lipopolysaccharide biosynthesis protein [Nitrospira sp.]|nr:MAG: lipopolysaccharide biosynthesis protein [Nitrospira sp.]
MWRDGVWVAAGQLVAALGVLVGVRLQTEVIPPDVYGQVALYSGVSTLILSVTCVPYWRGASLFWGEAVSQGLEEHFSLFVRRLVTRHLKIAATVVLLAGVFYASMAGDSQLAIFMLVFLLTIDTARSIEMAFLNAQREQRRYAIWNISEAWIRPLSAVFAVTFLGPRTEVVLGAYAVGSAATFAILKKRGSQTRYLRSEFSSEKAQDIQKHFWAYAHPLMPQGIVGWLSALADRYILANLVGLYEAGIYSAVHGLISRPFLMAQSLTELTIRPLYFQAVATEQSDKTKFYLYRWVLFNSAVGALLVIFCILSSDLLVQYLLGPAYAQSVSLIPYLAIGHLLLIIGYGLNGYLYAYKYTRHILAFDLLGALLALTISPILIATQGLQGAAVSCVVVYGIRTIALAVFVCVKISRTKQT